ncbi:MAG: metallopeptidase TldD-related protein, partial [Planctomycetota bacterium]
AVHKLDLKLHDPDYDGIESSQRIKLASQIEEAAMAQSDKIISTTSGYRDSFSETVKVHSNGLIVESRGTSFSAGDEVTVKGDGDSKPEDWYWATTRFKNELPTPEILGKKAADRALRKIGQKKIATGKYNMIIENRAVEKFIYWLIRPMQAGTLQQKNSYLENMLNKKIASEKLTSRCEEKSNDRKRYSALLLR